MSKKKSPNLEQLRMELKNRKHRRYNPYIRPQTLNPQTKPFSSRSSFTPSTSLPRSFPNRMHHQPPPPLPQPPLAREQRCTNCQTYLSAPHGVVELLCPIFQMAHEFARVDSSAVKIRCFHCKALVNGPSDLVQFPCPLCFVILDVGDTGREQEEEVNEVKNCFGFFL